MKCCEMQRHILAEFGHDPLAHAFNLVIRVVVAGNQQRGNFCPHLCFMPQVYQGIQHRLQV
jgi:hypothetical protein